MTTSVICATLVCILSCCPCAWLRFIEAQEAKYLKKSNLVITKQPNGS